MSTFRSDFEDYNEEILGCVGEDIQYRNKNSNKFKWIKGVFNRRYTQNFQGQTVVDDFLPFLEVLLRDVGQPEIGDEVIVEAYSWRVKSVQDTGRGYVELELMRC